MKNKALILIDCQQDFVSGTLGNEMAKAIIPRVKEKIAAAQRRRTAIIATMDTHRENYFETFEGRSLPIKHCIVGTEGWKICDEIYEQLEKNEYKILEKNTFGSKYLANVILAICGLTLYDKDKIEFIESIEPIEVCGLVTDICVIANVVLLRTMLPNTPIIVDSKACAGTTIEAHNAALEVMKSLQVTVI